MQCDITVDVMCNIASMFPSKPISSLPFALSALTTVLATVSISSDEEVNALDEYDKVLYEDCTGWLSQTGNAARELCVAGGGLLRSTAAREFTLGPLTAGSPLPTGLRFPLLMFLPHHDGYL
ncbi:uncharacterized protein LOC124369109 isoform X2 [Homalodisca vitripennis]|uniref:uncharacterized protein LOC124369109 isoform X2 n=1 Tax=Homalodisca vitripennis TaxID=197043 RepID=UPI001EEB814B|nr:uncharacterized protein LOC124369109 isoform X2 [Homalodisca vitripennis]